MLKCHCLRVKIFIDIDSITISICCIQSESLDWISMLFFCIYLALHVVILRVFVFDLYGNDRNQRFVSGPYHFHLNTCWYIRFQLNTVKKHRFSVMILLFFASSSNLSNFIEVVYFIGMWYIMYFKGMHYIFNTKYLQV